MEPSAPIDMRSDTVTRPTPAMREAMARADVGDDVFGEDPTVRRLEETVAALLGKEAAVFVPSGTMANQSALMALTQRGDEILVSEGAHCAWYESGAAAALSGVQPVSLGSGGYFDADAMERAIKPGEEWFPRTSVVAIENTHNRGGGRVWPMALLREVTSRGKARGLRLHLDGARLWNAAAALGLPPAEIAAPFDTVAVCFSKGLGAPVGSALCSTRELIVRVRKMRKMLGGGMRQAGIIAAGALYALEHHRDRLAEDHDNARAIASDLANVRGVRIDPSIVESNIVMVDTPGIASSRVAEEARKLGVLVAVFAPERVRVVTHLDVARTARQGGQLLGQAIAKLRSGG